MDEGFTPGEWDVKNATGSGASVCAVHGVTVAWCGRATAATPQGSHAVRAEEAWANATLTSAAPNLLRALRRMVDEGEGCPACGGTGYLDTEKTECGCRYTQALQAIEKALKIV